MEHLVQNQAEDILLLVEQALVPLVYHQLNQL
jgi:hypothetical protein